VHHDGEFYSGLLPTNL
jgi:hypothetical protein